MPTFHDAKHAYQFFRGARAYQERRRRIATARRQRLVELVAAGEYEPTTNQRLADALGISRGTLWADLQAIEAQEGRCPHCGQLLPQVVEGVSD